MASFGTPRVERDGSSGLITIHPAVGKHSATVVFCHGLGDSGEGFCDVAENMARTMPYCKFILPTASVRPVTLNGGMKMNAWYDIVGLSDRASESCAGIDESVALIRTLLEGESRLGISYERMVLAGFSQGGALSLFSGLQLPLDQRLAGVLVLSGYLPGASQFTITKGLESTPVLHCHGTSDPVVIPDWAVKTRDHVTEKGGIGYELKTYEGVGHTVTPAILSYAQAFLFRIIPDAPHLAIQPKAPSEMSVKELKEAVRVAGLGHLARGFYEKHEYVTLLLDAQKNSKSC